LAKIVFDLPSFSELRKLVNFEALSGLSKAVAPSSAKLVSLLPTKPSLLLVLKLVLALLIGLEEPAGANGLSSAAVIWTS
jgi:hypothetical protein